jgi:hypothetical protein
LRFYLKKSITEAGAKNKNMTTAEIAKIYNIHTRTPMSSEVLHVAEMLMRHPDILEQPPDEFFRVFAGDAPNGKVLTIDKKYEGHTYDPTTWLVHLFNGHSTTSLQAVTDIGIGGNVLNLRICPYAAYANQPPMIRDTIQGDLLQGRMDDYWRAEEVRLVNSHGVTFTSANLVALGALTQELKQSA